MSKYSKYDQVQQNDQDEKDKYHSEQHNPKNLKKYLFFGCLVFGYFILFVLILSILVGINVGIFYLFDKVLIPPDHYKCDGEGYEYTEGICFVDRFGYNHCNINTPEGGCFALECPEKHSGNHTCYYPKNNLDYCEYLYFDNGYKNCFNWYTFWIVVIMIISGLSSIACIFGCLLFLGLPAIKCSEGLCTKESSLVV